MANSLGQNQTPKFVGPDFGPKCLQRLSADDTRRRRFIVDVVTLLVAVTGQNSSYVPSVNSDLLTI